MATISTMTRNVVMAAFSGLLLQACASGPGPGGGDTNASARVSSTVAFSTSREIPGWLAKPGVAAVEAWVRFDENLAENTWFGVNVEFVGGTKNPVRFAKEDFAALVMVTREGLVAIPVGNDFSHKGTPDNNDRFEPKQLGRALAPNVWHRIRLEMDFSTLRFGKLIVESPGKTSQLDLSALKLSYPNPMPVDGRSLTWYVHAIANEAPRGGSGTAVLFDDVRGEVKIGGKWKTVYKDGFETAFSRLPDVPFTFPELKLSQITPGRLYLENERALVRHALGKGRSGSAIVADAAVKSR